MDDLFAGVDFYFIGDIDYGSTDPDEVVEIVRRLTIVARRFNLWVVTDFGGRAGPERQPGLVELAVGAAFQAYADFDPHPDPFDKAAMLLRGITQGHPFDDGNKRTGFLVAAYYLSKRDFGYSAFVDADAVVEFCLDISAGRVREINTIGDRLRRFWGQ